ncbi:hypothetical protein CAMSH0001_1589 [Campylobacter showae RM3277]|uniref:Uncharacterized protein n=1 Tax=Campylobacter showae RM3277 TaxID=553219 RepID=C6RD01_9BACT|nr:hypothetical protein CAMSH0001_1589 [Campylobacter showae RM3277]
MPKCVKFDSAVPHLFDTNGKIGTYPFQFNSLFCKLNKAKLKFNSNHKWTCFLVLMIKNIQFNEPA